MEVFLTCAVSNTVSAYLDVEQLSQMHLMLYIHQEK